MLKTRYTLSAWVRTSGTVDVGHAYLGAKTLVLTGVAGNICILFTANDAYMRDYDLVVPSNHNLPRYIAAGAIQPLAKDKLPGQAEKNALPGSGMLPVNASDSCVYSLRFLRSCAPEPAKGHPGPPCGSGCGRFCRW